MSCVVEKRKSGAKTSVGHWVGHMDNESGVGLVVCTKRQLFGKINNNTKYLSAVMHERHPCAAKGLCIICFSKLLGLLLGDHAHTGATQSKRSTETSCDIAVDHRDGGLLMKYLFIMHRTNILLNSRLYLIVY